MNENIHKVRYRRDVEYCIRTKNMGGTSDGGILWAFEYFEGDVDAAEEDMGDEWMEGIPSMSGAQLAEFCLWLCGTDPPGPASRFHPGRESEGC